MLPTKVDEDQFNSFRAKRQAERDAKRTLLAKEFPLLFGTDSKSRSTIGKYVNKPVPTTSLNPITPGKRKTQSTLGMKPMVDENTNSNGTHNIPSRMSTLVPNQKNNRKKSDVFSNAVQSPKKASRQTVAATSNARGSFLNYRSFSSRSNTQAPIAEVEMFGAEKEKDAASEEVSLPQEEIHEVIDPLQEQVHDVLDYLFETNEVDEGTHRRLSSQAFQKDSLRRLSMRASLVAEPQVADTTTTTAAPENHHEDAAVDESLEIDDMDVLQALRTYISTLDSVPESQPVEHAPAVRAPVVQQAETPAVPVRTPSRARNGFASPTPNTRVISITSPTGSHFKRPKQLSSPNPIRFPSRSRRESNGIDEEEVQQNMKTPPPAPVVTKATAPVSPNPMRLADAFRRGSVSGRKSMAATAKAQAASVVDDDDVLGLLATMDDVGSLPTTETTASKAERSKSKKQQQRRRSSAASNLPAALDPTGGDDDSLVFHLGEGGPQRKSILNSPSLKTMRVSFLTQAPVSNRATAMAEAIAAATEEVSATMVAPTTTTVASMMDLACSSTDALVAALDVVIDSLPVETTAVATAAIIDQPSVQTDAPVDNVPQLKTKETSPVPSTTVVEAVSVPQPAVEPIAQPPAVPAEPEATAAVSAAETVVAEPVVAKPDVAPTVVPVESTVAPVAAAAAEEMVVFHPRQMIYMEAMKRGVVCAELSKCMHVAASSKSSSPQVKYMIHVSMLPLPGNPAMYESLHMVLWKRFSEFRIFHQQLLSCPGVNVERIPVLPSRQIASFG